MHRYQSHILSSFSGISHSIFVQSLFLGIEFLFSAFLLTAPWPHNHCGPRTPTNFASLSPLFHPCVVTSRSSCPRSLSGLTECSEIVFQLQPTPRDSSPTTTDPPPRELISGHFSVIFESILSRFRVATQNRLENDRISTRNRFPGKGVGSGGG